MDLKYKDYIQIFTDGSKALETNATGLGISVPSYQVALNKRASDYLKDSLITF